MTTAGTGTTEPKAGAADQTLAPGTEVGEYVIENQLGKGGFGTVYRATHPVIGKQVAIKVLARRYSADEAIVSRFVAEAKAVNQIRHRNIIDIFAFGNLPDGRCYYVMEYLDGEPLDQYLRDRGPMTLEQATPILRAIARALDAAHHKGIAHRDLKPENIFLARESDGAVYPKLLDFGIAKLLAPEDDVRHRTGTGVPLGTPFYMSPEQCRGRDVDHRTDIYSFGIVVYRLLTGTYPFEGDFLELMTKQVAEDPEPPSSRNPELGPAVDRAVAWMMKKEPAERPRTVIAGVLALSDEGMAETTPAPDATTGRGSVTGGKAITAKGANAITANRASDPTLPAGALAEMPRKVRSIAIPVIAIALLGMGGAMTWYTLRAGTGSVSEAETGTGSGSVTGSVAVTGSGSVAVTGTGSGSGSVTGSVAAPPAPQFITLELDGAPAGTEVLLAGSLVGTAPKVQLTRGDKELVLALRADGYAPTSITITPTGDQKRRVHLQHKAAPPPVVKKTPKEHDPDSLPDVDFGKGP